MTETAFKFTEARVKAIAAPEEGRTYYADSESRLKLCSYAGGSKSFLLYRRVMGKPERIFIGKHPDMTVDDARKKADELNGDIAKGKNVAEERRQKRLEGTFGNLFERYLEMHARPNKQPRSVAEDEANYRRYLSGWKDRRLSTITRRDVQRLHAELRERNGVYAANRVLALLSTVFNKAAEYGWQGSNPCKGVKKFREEERERFLTADEMPRFLKALAEEPSLDFRDFILLDLLTGARRSNLLAMRWEEIDFAGAVWRIPRTKGNKVQSIPLAGPALKILEARRERTLSEWVFPSDIIPGQHVQEFRHPWKSLLKRAAITNLRPHDVRRTLGSWMSKSVALPVVKAALGHADISTTAIYARSENPEVRKAFEITAQRMLGEAHEENSQDG